MVKQTEESILRPMNRNRITEEGVNNVNGLIFMRASPVSCTDLFANVKFDYFSDSLVI